MARVSDLFDRFKPAGAPGPAGSVGVPGDRKATAEQELTPVFLALRDVERSCAELREQATRTANERLRRCATEAERVLADARREAEAERAAAAAQVRGPAMAELAQIEARAQAEAQQVRERAAMLQPALLEQIMAHVRTQLMALEQDDERAGPTRSGTPG